MIVSKKKLEGRGITRGKGPSRWGIREGRRSIGSICSIACFIIMIWSRGYMDILTKSFFKSRLPPSVQAVPICQGETGIK